MNLWFIMNVAYYDRVCYEQVSLLWRDLFWKDTLDELPARLRSTREGYTQARSHVGTFGGSSPANCVVSRKNCFKHKIKTKILPP